MCPHVATGRSYAYIIVLDPIQFGRYLQDRLVHRLSANSIWDFSWILFDPIFRSGCSWSSMASVLSRPPMHGFHKQRQQGDERGARARILYGVLTCLCKFLLDFV